MRVSFNRMMCCLLALVLVFTGVVSMALPAKADYENTYVNTGDQRKDIVGVARTQVGYRQSSSGYTKYGEWYGSSYMEWCAAFICWCANQADIPTSIIRKNGFAYASSFGLKSFTVQEKTPQPGDLFFKSSGHAGIVYYIEGSYFYTLEGNTWANGDSHPRVMIRQRKLNDSQYNFASPNYQGSSSSGGCSHSYVKGAETAHPHKEYYQCSKCNYSYYTGTNKTVNDCQSCIMENCSHKFSEWTKIDNTYHTASCSKCTKVEKSAHDWKDGKILKEPTCKDAGLKEQICSQCKAERETQIPATEEHQYSQWLYSDSHSHYRICEVCDTQEEGEHTIAKWKTSATEHWYECEECSGRLSIGKHMLSGACGTECSICEKIPQSGHMFSAKWSSNSKSHWHRCVNCAKTQNEAEHDYSSDCDETCDTCGYERQVTHSYGTKWESDSTGHWVSCEKCGQKRSVQAHTAGATAAAGEAQLCSKCGFEMVSAQAHIHTYRYLSDSTSHWGSCACGQLLSPQSHSWQMDTGKCALCQAEQPAVSQNPELFGLKLPMILKNTLFWEILLLGMGVLLILVVLIMVIAAIRRKVRYSAAAALRREFDEEDEDDADTYEEEDASEEEPVSV